VNYKAAGSGTQTVTQNKQNECFFFFKKTKQTPTLMGWGEL
jgi:hypothetical protein